MDNPPGSRWDHGSPRQARSVPDGGGRRSPARPAGHRSDCSAIRASWKDLFLPVLHLLEPRLAPGTLVVADDTGLDSMQPYLTYVRAPGSGYENVTFPVEDGMEISCRT